MKVLTGHLLITRVFTHPESGERRLLVEDYHGRHNLQVHDSYSSRRLNKLGNLLNFKDIPPNRVVRIYDNFAVCKSKRLQFGQLALCFHYRATGYKSLILRHQ